MPVVSDTSPVLNLAIIGQLHLLRQQFGEILIPPAVASELKLDTELPGTGAAREAMVAGWLRTAPLADSVLAVALRHELNAGESEAIALAVELRAEHILIDEADGRSAARRLGLKPVGVVGILLRAKRAGALTSVGEALAGLVEHAGFYLSDKLLKAALSEAGEPSLGEN